MEKNCEVQIFKNEQEAEELLANSRKRIDEIDNELFELICQRTSFAKDIALAKDFLNMDIYDKKREENIHEKIETLAEEKDLDVDIINQIMNMLTILSKNEQKEILRRNVNG